jgi:hypothetical protein
MRRVLGWLLLSMGALSCRAPLAPSVPPTEGEGEGGGEGEGEGGTWRSTLYPADWHPAFSDASGRFLHDFSFAGYRYGEAWPETVPGPLVDAVERGADPTGATDSTAVVQAVLDELATDVDPAGGTLWFPAGLYRFDGLLTVTTPGVLLQGAGPASQLAFAATDLNGRASLTFRGTPSEGPDLTLVVDGAARSHELWLEADAPLAVGDDVDVGMVITDAFVDEHGMTGTWQVANGQWRAFFRRTVTAVEARDLEGALRTRVSLDVPLRSTMLTRDRASVRRVEGMLHDVGVRDLAVGNAIDAAVALSQDRAHVLAFEAVKDAFVEGVSSFAPPSSSDGGHLQSGGILVEQSKRVTIADTILENAQHRGSGGNGYLFELLRSSEVLIRDSTGRNGRHNFIQNWDFNTNGCVFLRVTSIDGRMDTGLVEVTGTSEFHHSLAMANLIDGAVSTDGWGAVNRGAESSGAGHSATENVFWNVRGGFVRSLQFGWGYVIGTTDAEVLTGLDDLFGRADGTEPEDFVEGVGQGGTLQPESLYEDQRARRLGQ